MDADGNGRWLTYDELAEVRGIDRQSARRLANRAKLRRQEDNHKIVRVFVPAFRLDRPRKRDESADVSADMPTVTPAVMPANMSTVIKPLESALATLQEQLGRERTRADQAEADAARERQSRDAERARADQAETTLKLAEARATRAETAAAKWDAWLASGLGARLKAVFWKA